MHDEAEQALIVLADPIIWTWTPYTRGGGLPPRSGGQWIGQTGQTTYKISSPSVSDDVDASPRQRSWNVSLRLDQTRNCCNASAPTAEWGKELCRQHALAGDLSELHTLAKAGQEAENEHNRISDTAVQQLLELVRLHQPARLEWQPCTADNLEIHAIGTRGNYTAVFTTQHRWCVTFSSPDSSTETHRFLTRVIASLACHIHAQTGEWHGRH